MIPGQVKFLEATNNSIGISLLRYLQANEAMPMLVMYLSWYGNNNYQVKYMHQKATAWATPIKEGGVQQNKVWKDRNYTIP